MEQKRHPMDVSVLIVSFNTADLLRRCLASIYEHVQGVEFEVIVVDNASSDNSAHVVRHEFPQAVVAENEENVGFGAALNRAAKHATGRYLLLLNPDAELHNNAVRHFVEFMEAHEAHGIGALGANLTDRGGRPVHSFADFINIRRDLGWRYRAALKKLLKIQTRKSFGRRAPRSEPGSGYIEVDYVTGADLFMTRALFTDLGGFDEAYFMYSEEMDLQYRMMQRGLRRLIVEGPRISHEVGGSFSESNRRRIMMTVGQLTFVRRRYGVLRYKVYKAGLLGAIALDWLAEGRDRASRSAEGREYFGKVLREEFR